MRYLLDIAIAIAGIILGVLATNAWHESAKPQSYADCILDKARGLSKELAVVAKAACRDRFPGAKLNLPKAAQPAAPTHALPPDALFPEEGPSTAAKPGLTEPDIPDELVPVTPPQ